MTSVDGVYWALAAAILAIAGGLTFLLVRMAGSVNRLNRILGAVGEETPASLTTFRKILENAERVSSDLADTTSVVREGASTIRLVVDKVKAAVTFLDETVFSKLSALAPIFAALGALLGRFVTGGVSKGPAPGDRVEAAKEE